MAADVVYHVFLCYFERGMKKNKLYLFAILAQLSGAAESNNPFKKTKTKQNIENPSGPWKRKFTDSTMTARQTDNRNCYCQRFVSMQERRKALSSA